MTTAETIAAIEAQLAASWDAAHLAIYGDALQAVGDPRGELIAIDLRTAASPAPELASRRRALLDALVGGHVVRRFDATRFEYGFVETIRIPSLSSGHEAAFLDLLGSPLGPYLRRVEISGAAAHVRQHVALLARAPQRWLLSLAIRLDDSYGSRAVGPIISKRATAALIAATPRLERLSVESFGIGPGPRRPVFAAFDHPTVRDVRL